MRVLLDTNVILDLLLARDPFIDSTVKLFERLKNENVEG
ncbi:PIN domain-containing protein [Nonlabens spongiae]